MFFSALIFLLLVPPAGEDAEHHENPEQNPADNEDRVFNIRAFIRGAAFALDATATSLAFSP